jgi:nitronate monooxygenase
MLKTPHWLFGLERPIVLAPLAGGATSGHLAAAVSDAGGLGLFGGIHPGGPEWIREQIRFLRSRASGAWGVGFITWMIPGLEASFHACLDEQVPTLAFSFGDPTPYTARAKLTGAKVICQVQSIESLRVALAAGVDVVVAQGNEAGGHSGSLARPLPRAGLGDRWQTPHRIRWNRQRPRPRRGACRRG